MTANPLTVQAVADLVGGRLSGPGDGLLRRVRSLEQAGPDALAMCASRKVRPGECAARSRAGAVLVADAMAADPGPATRIVVADPARAMFGGDPGDTSRCRAGARNCCNGADRSGHKVWSGRRHRARYAIIGAGVRIGARARIGAHVVIEDDVTLGDDVRLDPHAVIYSGATLGNRVWCKASAVIGGPGFGYSSDANGHTRIPHVGGCILEDDVEIGSNSSVVIGGRLGLTPGSVEAPRSTTTCISRTMFISAPTAW